MHLLGLSIKLLRWVGRNDMRVLPFAVVIGTLIAAIIITARWPEYKQAFRDQGIDHIDILVWHIDMK